MIDSKETAMADKKSKNLVVPQGGMLRDLVVRLKLIGRLMGDRRVNFFIKFLPLFSLAYLFWPLDAIAIPFVGVLDDAAILWVGSNLFLELCPPDVVKEHREELQSNLDDTDDVIDAESTDVND
jgi:uncharacterized membrane protein YkvA (DUF1232 family)